MTNASRQNEKRSLAPPGMVFLAIAVGAWPNFYDFVLLAKLLAEP